MYLPGITLFAVDTTENRSRTIKALKFCLKQVKFDNAIFVTNKEYFDENFSCEIKIVNSINSVHDYSKFMIKDLNNYIDTDYVLTIQHDGFILNPENWLDAYLNVDYIGAPWTYRKDPYFHPLSYNVGNGGFSLRSKKLLKVLSDIKTFPEILPDDWPPEDLIICSQFHYYRNGRLFTDILREDYAIKFAPYALASEFSVENSFWDGQFGFHGRGTNLTAHKLVNNNWNDKSFDILDL